MSHAAPAPTSVFFASLVVTRASTGYQGETWRTKQEEVKAVLFEMFTSQARIDRKTGPDNLGRFEYLQALVTEFQDTDKQGNVTERSIR